MSNTILIIDDDTLVQETFRRFLTSRNYNVLIASNAHEGLTICRTTPPQLALIDLHLPDLDGLEVLQQVKSIVPNCGTIIVTGHGDVQTATQAIKLKADEFIEKPVHLQNLLALIEKTIAVYAPQSGKASFPDDEPENAELAAKNLGHLPEALYHAILLIANNDSTSVLLMGETGTGKSLIASTIHSLSNRHAGPFIDINCAGLSPQLLESELFGHMKGAFTDAKQDKQGLFEAAHKGTIFLDEMAEMGLNVQAKVLKVIENQMFRRLGATAITQVDVRIIAATNADLQKEVEQKRFREDLYYRLNVIPITLPPLRERKSQILPLAQRILSSLTKELKKNIRGFSPAAESILMYYSYPGNIRELRNIIERAIIVCDEEYITALHLPEHMRNQKVTQPLLTGDDLSLDNLERRHIQRVLDSCNQNHTQAAEILKIHRSTLIRKMKKYNLT